ncbi:MAG: hypothetical protein QXE64_00230 [Candidatus Pacearchaeota archaeon]
MEIEKMNEGYVSMNENESNQSDKFDYSMLFPGSSLNKKYEVRLNAGKDRGAIECLLDELSKAYKITMEKINFYSKKNLKDLQDIKLKLNEIRKTLKEKEAYQAYFILINREDRNETIINSETLIENILNGIEKPIDAYKERFKAYKKDNGIEKIVQGLFSNAEKFKKFKEYFNKIKEKIQVQNGRKA